MEHDQLQYEIRKRKLEFLVNKLEPGNWGILLMAIVFAYFYWESTPRFVIYIWLAANLIITLARALFVYPQYFRTEITTENIDTWLNWFTISLGINGLCWGIALPFFFVPDDIQLLLVLIFAFFILMSSSTQTLASHRPGFIAFSIPLVTSIAWLFIFGGDRIHTEFGIVFFYLV